MKITLTAEEAKTYLELYFSRLVGEDEVSEVEITESIAPSIEQGPNPFSRRVWHLDLVQLVKMLRTFGHHCTTTNDPQVLGLVSVKKWVEKYLDEV